jgi:hypothetical protein
MKHREEEVGISGVHLGPRIISIWKPYEFRVELDGCIKDWFTSPLKIMHPKYATVGEANRAHLHERLDALINEFLKS